MSDVRVRWLEHRTAAASTVALFLLLSGCGGETSQAESTSLPLQDEGLAIGGDVQSRATDVVEAQITEEQSREIAEACNDAVEIAGTGEDDCLDVVQLVFDGDGEVCTPVEMCLRVYEVDALSEFDGSGIIEIIDPRPAGALCDDNPSQVCLRVGVGPAELLADLTGAEADPTSATTTSTTTSTTPSASTVTPTSAASSSGAPASAPVTSP